VGRFAIVVAVGVRGWVLLLGSRLTLIYAGSPVCSSSQAIVQPSAATASRSMHSQARGTPRGGRPVCRSGRVDGGMIQPYERPLDNPAPPPQAAAVFSAAHRQHRQSVTRAQPAPDGCRIIAAVAKYTGGPAPGPTASPLQRRNRTDQGQGFLRVISISAGQADCEWDALRVVPPIVPMTAPRLRLLIDLLDLTGTAFPNANRPRSQTGSGCRGDQVAAPGAWRLTLFDDRVRRRC
jgi:hypothetical protein